MQSLTQETSLLSVEGGGVFILGMVSYLSTSLDNLVLTVVLLGTGAARRLRVLLGVWLSALALLAILSLSLYSRNIVNAGLMGYVGLLPLSLGLWYLLSGATPSAPSHRVDGAAGWGMTFSTGALLLANSGDSLALLLPLAAETRRDLLPLLAIAVRTAAVAFSFLALRLATLPGLSARAERYGMRLLPWIMIAVGLYVLSDTATDSLL